MVAPSGFWLVFAVALLISAIGFKHYIWFFSIGYGFAIAGEGILLAIRYMDQLTPGTLIGCLLFIAYGLRLGGFLVYREMGRTAYLSRMKGEIKDSKTVPMFVKVSIWLACAVLYVTQVVPMFYRLANGSGSNIFTYIGVAIMALGLIMETAADMQKNAAKKTNAGRFVDTGLYRIVRCPNYLGEMIFWTGCVISGIGSVTGAQWILVVLGYIGITYVMFSGARRLELRQNRNYGNDPEYQQYVKTVPIMIPFIPLYSVVKYKWLVA